MSSSSSLFMSLFHMASAVNAGLVRSFWSKQASLMFSHDRFDDFGEVAILLKGVFGFLPKCASNGAIFLVAFELFSKF